MNHRKNTWRVLLFISVGATILALSPSAQAFDHAHDALTQVLKQHVKGGRVNYGALAGDSRLEAYVKTLGVVTKQEMSGWSSAERLAFWANAYNALTLKLIVDKKPKKSIKDIGDPWTKPKFSLAGRSLSLNAIEHEIIRKRFSDPRVHMVLVCAAKSCPILESRALTSKNIYQRMESASRRFARDTQKNVVSASSLSVSKIFEWFGQDFVKRYSAKGGGTDQSAAIRGFFAHFTDVTPASDAKISFQAYDWSLNGHW